MSTLDDTFERLQLFQRDLRSFSERMAASFAELAGRHAELDPLWRDSFRRRYDEAWEPLVRTVASFRDHEAPAYDRFLSEKLVALDEYLHGRR